MIGARNGNLALLLLVLSRIPMIIIIGVIVCGNVGAWLKCAGGTIQILPIAQSNGTNISEERNFGVMNLRKKLLADALVQWHVSQHLRSDIIIPHDGCGGEVRRKVPRKLPGDKESSVRTS